jgi:hypothetical protein
MKFLDRQQTEYDFNSVEDLKNIEYVKNHISSPYYERLSIAYHETWAENRWKYYLMLETNDNKYWVIGYLSQDCADLNLPTWTE